EFMSFRVLRENGLPRTFVAVLGFGTLLELFCFVGNSLLVQALFACILLLIFAIGAWGLLLDREERSLLLFAVGRLRAAFGRATRRLGPRVFQRVLFAGRRGYRSTAT